MAFRVDVIGLPASLPPGTYPSRVVRAEPGTGLDFLLEYAPDKTLRDTLVPIVVTGPYDRNGDTP